MRREYLGSMLPFAKWRGCACDASKSSHDDVHKDSLVVFDMARYGTIDLKNLELITIVNSSLQQLLLYQASVI